VEKVHSVAPMSVLAVEAACIATPSVSIPAAVVDARRNFQCLVVAVWQTPEEDSKVIDAVHSWAVSNEKIANVAGYINYGGMVSDDQEKKAHGEEALDRIKATKVKYDPHNLLAAFRARVNS